MIAAILLMAVQPTVPPSPRPPSEVSPTPSAEALTLGQELARTGVLATLLPLIVQQETEQLVAANAQLPAAEIARLRQIAATEADQGVSKIIGDQAAAYAAALSIDDLRSLAAHARSDAAAHARAAMPAIIAAAMVSASTTNFKGDVRTAFCANSAEQCQLNLP